MKIIFSSQNRDWESLLDERFGRAIGFNLYDEESGILSWHSNEDNLNAAHGAGTQAAQFVINSGALVLISGKVGPKAFDLLDKTGIEIYNSDVDKLKSIYNAYKQGKLIKQTK